jgi:NitT/TauT family transport system substrate-binding protein
MTMRVCVESGTFHRPRRLLTLVSWLACASCLGAGCSSDSSAPATAPETSENQPGTATSAGLPSGEPAGASSAGNSNPTAQDSRKTAGGSVALTPVTLALNWYAESEHGGYLAARTHGYYADQGLQVEIVPGGPGAPQQVIAELAAERISFAISDADNVVKARAAGVPLVAILAPLQNSPRCIMVHEASGITSLQELSGIELAISEGRPFALWMKKKLPLTNVSMVPYNGSVGEFLTKPNFAQQAYTFSEPFVAREQGGDPRVLLVSDIGFNPYACLLVTTEKMIAENRDVVQKMVRATTAGWAQYLKSPQQTNSEIHAENPDMSLEVLQFGAEQLKPLCAPAEGISPCGMTVERWQQLVSQIEELGETEIGAVKPESCFSDEFLVTGGASVPASTAP